MDLKCMKGRDLLSFMKYENLHRYSQMKHINKVCSPYLSFPEFSKEKWIFLPLKNIATIRSERAGNKKCILLSVSSGVGLISQKEKFGREIAGKQYERYFLVHENDFVYNKSATKTYPQGTINLYHNKELAAVPSSIFTCFYVDFNIINIFYLKYLFKFNIHGKWLRKFITTGARAHGSFNIDSKDFLSIPIPIPLGEKSLSEQQKIADCLSSLDELIEAHEQKLDALKQHKKGLMQRLFPAKGETAPRWRFPEFRNTGEWISIKLGEICSISTGKKDANQGNNTGLYPFFTCAEKTIYSNTYSFDGEALLIAGNANVGLTKYYNGKFEAYQRTYVLMNFKKINTQYLYIFLTSNLQKYLKNIVQSSAMQYIKLPMLKEYDILLPKDCKEQKKIADCLTSVDEQIKTQEEKIMALKEHQKGLMQKLFPSL